MANATDFTAQIADYLEEQGVGYSVAASGHPVDIFVNKQPDDIDDCVTVYGLPGVDGTHSNTPDIYYPRFQVIVRNVSYEEGAAKLKEVRDALHDKLGVELATWYCWFIRALQEGGPIGEDDKGRSEFSINFNAQSRYVQPTP